MSYMIGIDGGGTKTRAVLVDLKGRVLGDYVVGTTNPNTISEEELNTTFQQLFHHFKTESKEAFQQIRSVFAGVSGAGSEHSRQLLKSIITNYVDPDVFVEVQPDTINALYSGTYGKPGIVQISGTGSITYGINFLQEHGRVGGWGYLLGDEGSGYDIGKQGLISALKAYDGRGDQTKLLGLVYDYFDMKNPRDIIDMIYTSPTPKASIAPLSKLVFDAYKDDDAVAVKIIEQCSEEMINSIITLYNRLFPSSEPIDVVLCGGVFSDPDILLPMIKTGIERLGYDISVVIPKLPPVGGSVIAAYVNVKDEIPSVVIKKLIAQL